MDQIIEMHDLTEYARKVDNATTLEQAQDAMIVLIDKFKFKKKQQAFKDFTGKRNDIKKLQKWAWDLVLRGESLQVIQ